MTSEQPNQLTDLQKEYIINYQGGAMNFYTDYQNGLISLPSEEQLKTGKHFDIDSFFDNDPIAQQFVVGLRESDQEVGVESQNYSEAVSKMRLQINKSRRINQSKQS